jgi:hypothetical protein
LIGICAAKVRRFLIIKFMRRAPTSVDMTGGGRGQNEGHQLNLPLEAEDIFLETAAAIDELYQEASKPGEAARWEVLLDRIAGSIHMAPYNLLLADIQRPGARLVAFPSDWKRLGREIKPAAIPILVLWPFGPMRCAYDLSDTTGAEVEDSVLEQMFGTAHSMKEGLFERLCRRAAKEDNVEVAVVSFGLVKAGDARVLSASQSDKGKTQKPRWLVRIASHLNEAAKLMTLVHELAHVYVGHLGGNGRKWAARQVARHDVREFEAEAVSFVVGRRLGIHTGSADYLRKMMTADTIQHVSIAAVARAAGRIEQHLR